MDVHGLGTHSMAMALEMPYRFGRYVLDPVNKTLHRDGDEVRLRPRTFDVMAFLVERAGRLVTKEELHSALWRGVVVTDDALVHCVGEIRQALGDDSQEMVRTVSRRGYVFTLQVAKVGDATGASRSGTAATSIPAAPRSAFRRLASPRSLLVSFVSLAVVIALALSLGGRRTPAPALSIAVLPFTSLNADPDQEYLAEALVDDITTDLARLPQTLVIARNSANAYRGTRIDPPVVGKELGVGFLVQGSVHRLEDEVRLNLRLTDAVRGIEIWAERIDGDRRDLAALHRHVTDSIARTLHVELVDAEARRVAAERRRNPDAHDLEMRGWALWNRQEPGTVAEARELLKRSLALEPAAASAWSTLSATYTADLLYGWVQLRGHTREEWMQLQEQAAVKAYVLDPRHMGPTCSAMMFRGQIEQSLACRERQIELRRPDPLPYHMAALAHLYLGQPEPVIALEQQAIRVSPRDTRLRSFTIIIARAELERGRYRDALALAEKTVNMSPRFAPAYVIVAAAAVETGDMERARRAVAEFRRLEPRATIATLRQDSPSDRPAFVAGQERIFDALRKAGLPD